MPGHQHHAAHVRRKPLAPLPDELSGPVHGEILRAVCRIANGITVTDEVGGHSSMWFRVEHDGKQVWMPAIRIRPEQVENTTLPGCPN
ncbi:hypothetical protein ACPCUV_03380 [Streptomyces platensis]|uniref:hypothetical protein n=1 Tax=Streptomyces platensis TaxID=58346 RepID=UPI003C2C1CAF